MKTFTFLWIVIACLFLLNLGTLVIVFTDRNKKETPFHPQRFDEMVINTLQLNEDQIVKFDHLKREHHEMIVQLDEEMKAPIESYFKQLLLKNDTSNVQPLEQQISTIYLKKLRVTQQHFEAIKRICTHEQQQHFEELIPQMIQVMHPKPPMRK